MLRHPPLLKLLAGVVVLAAAGLGITRAEVPAETLQAISMPNEVQTSIGTLEFFDGVPGDVTINTLYDNLDRMLAVEVYLNNSGAASLNAMRAGNASIGADSSWTTDYANKNTSFEVGGTMDLNARVLLVGYL